METDGLYFVGPDAIECLKQKNFQAIEHCLLLKSMLRDPEYRDILEPIAEAALDGKIKLNLHLVEEDTDVGQRLTNYGGVVILLSFQIYLENDCTQLNEGKEFVDWNTFDDAEY